MDAATRFRRTLAVLALAAGCQAAEPGLPVGRGQTPPAEPVRGLPVATPAGFTAPPTTAALAALAGDPRIKVVAQVGLRNTVTDHEVWEAARQRVHDYISVVDGPRGQEVLKDDAKAKEVYQEELRRIIERELVLDEMETKLKKLGKPAVMESIKEFAGSMADRRIRMFKEKFKAKSDDDLKSILAVQGLTIPVIRRQLERQIMAEEYVRTTLKERGKSVGIGDVRRYYDAHPDEYTTTDKVKWLDIFISTNKFPSREAAKAHAEQVRAAAAAPGADFVALCKAHDHGIAANQKGEGIGEKRGEIQPAEVEPAVWATPAAEVGPLVETPAGFHVIKVMQRHTAGLRPFDQVVQDDVREKLMRQLQEAEYQRLVQELWRRGTVHVTGQ